MRKRHAERLRKEFLPSLRAKRPVDGSRQGLVRRQLLAMRAVEDVLNGLSVRGPHD